MLPKASLSNILAGPYRVEKQGNCKTMKGKKKGNLHEVLQKETRLACLID